MTDETYAEVIMGRDPVTKVLTQQNKEPALRFDPIFRPHTETVPHKGTIAPYHPDNNTSDFMPAAAQKYDC